MEDEKYKERLEALSADKLTIDQLINAMLVFCKEASLKHPKKTFEAITMALSNGIFEADSYKSLGYEEMAIVFGMAFRLIEARIGEQEKLDTDTMIMIHNSGDDEVYH